MWPAQEAEAFRVTVTDANTGGLLATVGSLPAFLPFSLMLKDASTDWLSPDVSGRLPPVSCSPSHMPSCSTEWVFPCAGKGLGG